MIEMSVLYYNFFYLMCPACFQLDRNNEAQRIHLDDLEKIIEKDPLTPLHEQEKDMVWRLRNECQFYFPESLPRLLMCVKWNNHVDVAQVSSTVSRLLTYVKWNNDVDVAQVMFTESALRLLTCVKSQWNIHVDGHR